MPMPRIHVTNDGDTEVEVIVTPLLEGRYGVAVVLPQIDTVPREDAIGLRREAARVLRDLAVRLEEGTD